jgi:hypothetical protein
MAEMTLSFEARGFGALRVLADGRGRAYTEVVVEDANGWTWLNHHLRMARATGFVGLCNDDDYALLDVLDEAGDIIQEFGIPTRRAFAWWYRKMGWRVESTDGHRAAPSVPVQPDQSVESEGGQG